MRSGIQRSAEEPGVNRGARPHVEQ